MDNLILFFDPFALVIAGLLFFISFNYGSPYSLQRLVIVIISVGILAFSGYIEYHEHQAAIIERAERLHIEEKRRQAEQKRVEQENKRKAEEARLATLRLEREKAAMEAKQQREAEVRRRQQEAERQQNELAQRAREAERQRRYNELQNSYVLGSATVGIFQQKNLQFTSECVYPFGRRLLVGRDFELRPYPQPAVYTLKNLSSKKIQVNFVSFANFNGDCLSSIRALKDAGHLEHIFLASHNYSDVMMVHQSGRKPRATQQSGNRTGDEPVNGEQIIKGIFGAILNNALNNK